MLEGEGSPSWEPFSRHWGGTDSPRMGNPTEVTFEGLWPKYSTAKLSDLYAVSALRSPKQEHPHNLPLYCPDKVENSRKAEPTPKERGENKTHVENTTQNFWKN